MVCSSHKNSFLMVLLVATFGTMVGCDRIGKTVLKSAVTGATVRTVSHSSDDEVRGIFAAANAQCPIRMDAFTTLERIDVIDDVNVEYHYRVNQQGSKLVAKLDTQLLQQLAVEQMQGNPIAVAVAERGLSVRHVYHDESNVELLAYVINKSVIEGDTDPVVVDQSNPFAAIAESLKEQSETEEWSTDVEPDEVDELNADSEAAIEENDWLSEDETSEKKDEPQPWRVQTNPFFEA